MQSNTKPLIIQNHIGRFSFDFFECQTKIVSIGQDCVFKIYDISAGRLDMVKQLNSEDSIALAVNPITDLIYLDEGKSVQSVDDIEDSSELTGDEIASFTGPVHAMSLSGPKNDYLAICSSKNSATILKFARDGKVVSRQLPMNHIGGCLYAVVDPQGEYVASIGCEGALQIYSLGVFDNSQPELKNSLKVTFATQPESEVTMQSSWNGQQELALGGNPSLQIAYKNIEGIWAIRRVPEISHQRVIHICLWCENDKMLITVGVERKVRVWDFIAKIQLAELSCDNDIYTIKYCQESKTLFVGDSEGNLQRWDEVDYERLRKAQQVTEEGTQSILPKKVVTKEKNTPQSKIISLETPKKQSMSKISASQQMQDTTDFFDRQVVVHMNQKQKPKEVDLLKIVEERQNKKKDESAGKSTTNENNILESDSNLSVLASQMPAKPRDKLQRNLGHGIIHSSTVSRQLNRLGLVWNNYGTIILREEDSNSFIDVDFKDNEYHPKINPLKNLHNFSMAALNKNGFVLASKPIGEFAEIENDKEDFDRFGFLEEAYDHSFVYFQSLDKDNLKVTWNAKLPKKENVETIAIGDGWCAVSTDYMYVRIFGFSGLEHHCFCIDKPIICLSGYNNVLALIYQDGEPICGCPSLKLRIIDVETGDTFKELGLALTPMSTLIWFTFSEEGLPLCKDSKGIVRALLAYSVWTTIYEQPYNRNFWIKGMKNYEMVGFILQSDELEPRLASSEQPNEKRVKISLPLMSGTSSISEDQLEEMKELKVKQFTLKHEEYRQKQFLLSGENEFIPDLRKEIDTRVLKLFQKYVQEAEYTRGFNIVKANIINPVYLDTCVIIAQKVKQRHLEQSLINLQRQKQLSEASKRSLESLQSHTSSRIVVSQKETVEMDTSKKSKASKILVEEHSLDREEEQKQTKETETHVQSNKLIGEKKPATIGNPINNPFLKKTETKKEQSLEDGLFNSNNNQPKKRKDELMTNNVIAKKPQDSKKLKQ